jgi:hypothetical protein
MSAQKLTKRLTVRLVVPNPAHSITGHRQFYARDFHQDREHRVARFRASSLCCGLSGRIIAQRTANRWLRDGHKIVSCVLLYDLVSELRYAGVRYHHGVWRILFISRLQEGPLGAYPCESRVLGDLREICGFALATLPKFLLLILLTKFSRKLSCGNRRGAEPRVSA